MCHGLFILKLRQRYGFHATAAALVSSYLFPRYQEVASEDDVSPLAPLVAGAPQGFPISPLLFSLFIDNMAWSFQNTTCLLTICKFIIANRGKCFLNVFVRLTVTCRGFLNGLLPIL
jgi:hypothetical protein